MYRKSFLLMSLLIFIFISSVNAVDQSLVAWWKLDESTGTTAVDSSGHENTGTVQGGGTWATGKFGGSMQFNGTSSYISAPHIALDSRSYTIAMWLNPTAMTSLHTFFCQGVAATNTLLHFRLGGANPAGQAPVNGIRMGFYNNDLDTPANIIQTNIWYHVTFVYDYGTGARRIYIDGVQQASQTSGVAPYTATTGNTLLGSENGTLNWYQGMMDDVRIYTRVLSVEEIQKLLVLQKSELASDPTPDDKETDVYKETFLSWTPGQFADTHNVFFGTDFNDVNDATTANPLGVTVSQGLVKDVNSFDPGTLELGKTYYWRVDEVNAPASIGQYKGQTWSFTVEPVALKLTKENIIKVTVKNSAANNDPNNTINGAGLDPNTDLHSTGGCWVSGSANAADPAWIRYDFDRLYKIHEMFVWNYNVVASSKYGFKSVRIEYSTNGSSWTDLNTVTEFASGTSKVGYACNTTVPFNDIVASSVRITALSIQSGTYTKAGLAEVRFTIIPTYARIPSPGTGETDFSIDRILSWRPGREADKHDVYISTDSAAVLNHAVPAHTVTVNGYSPLLDFGRTYYWSVTEVSNTMTPSRWAGDIWDFTTAEYGSLDDFEDYNGVSGREIYSFWLDGYESITNGSIIGLNNSPYVETTIVQHGKQSAPISYDNTGTLEPAATYSEVTRTFDTALNLKVSGADSLRLYYRGQAITFGELSGCIAMSGEGADIGGTSDQFRYAYKTLTGNGSITARVDSVENKNAATEAGIMIRNTIDANSAFAMANLIPNGTPSFQRRLTAGASAASTNLTAIGNPYWVKITRNGSTFTAQRSADGTNWVSFETDANKPTTATITMGNNVLIGFVVSSHVADVIAAATFSGVATSGNISTGAWTVAPIGDATQADGLNTIDALYVVAEDNAGNKSKVFAPGDAVGSAVWMQLTIPYSQFTSVDMSKLKKLTIGVGDLAATAKGKGNIYIDNISYGHTIVK